MLSSAEYLSNRFGKKKKESFFAKYNLNNAGNKKKINLKSGFDLKMINLFHDVFNKAQNYHYPTVKNPKYQCNFGDIKQYNLNTNITLENVLNNNIKSMKLIKIII